ncbi:MAG: hypothetical protein DA407_11140 [Bacteroidetes bacterium]|nr:MAG: hypothetical protein DA407_11140 [Bacteroidota bacterium]
MHILIQSTLHTLQNANILLTLLSNSDLSNSSAAPYYSSIGTHIRHILDFYDCILTPENKIDLTARRRLMSVETNCASAIIYFEELQEKLRAIDSKTLNRIVLVTDDLGLGKTEIKYTFSALLAQANSHTIHHYAIINYILDGLGISIEDKTFGYNPTTPKSEINLT